MDAEDDRHETRTERLDRNWEELLQELRVTQTGVQLIAGFLLTLPFQSRFEDLGPFAVRLYLCLVVLAALTIGLTLTPVAVHRSLFGRHVKDRLVATGHLITRVVLLAISLLICGICVLVFEVVVSRTAAVGVGLAMVAVLAVLLVAVPAWLRSRSPTV